MAFAHLCLRICLSSFQPCPIFVCFCDYTLSEIHAEVTVYRFPNNALIPSDVIKPSVLIKLWRLSKVKLHETEMVQTYIQCILFFCPEQLSSNHKQWVWITHYRRRVSLEMAFCFRSDPNRWTNSEVGNFMSKYFEPKGRLFYWLRNTFLKFTFTFVYHCEWCHLFSALVLAARCRMSVM